jgi:DNA repair protein RadC
MIDNNNVHIGHRQRLKNRFKEEGLDNFDDHQVLELLLFHAIPRGDTNPIAHHLIKRFGSLSAVLERLTLKISLPSMALARRPRSSWL